MRGLLGSVMEREAPEFSILLPTFNRADIIHLAIESVLRQTFQDFELIISNGGSSDSTDAVVRNFSDTRIRYFSSPTRLSMAENYEKALEMATGNYLIFFSDDDAFVPSMLQRVFNVIVETKSEMVVFPFAHYYLEGDAEAGVPVNALRHAPFTSKTLVVNSVDYINRMSGRFFLSRQTVDDSAVRPLIGNVVIRKHLVDIIRSKTDSIFATVPVDGYFITLVLSVIDTYRIVDQPLLVWSQWTKNSSTTNGRELRSHYEALLGERTLDRVPLKFALPVNCAANAVLQAAHDMGNLRTVPVDWQWYYLRMYEYLLFLDANGTETSLEQRELNAILATESSDTRQFVLDNKKAFVIGKHRLKKIIRASVPFAFQFANSLRRVIRRQEIRTISGIDHGFNNVLEGSQYLDSVLSEK